MNEAISKVQEFNDAFDVRYRLTFDEHLPSTTIELRQNLMLEEVKEWADSAFGAQPIEERAKELADILYVVFGTILTEGLQDVIEDVFNEVHKSNMSKLGANGKPLRRTDGKILKSTKYKAPDLSFIKGLQAKEEKEATDGGDEQLEQTSTKSKGAEKK